MLLLFSLTQALYGFQINGRPDHGRLKQLQTPNNKDFEERAGSHYYKQIPTHICRAGKIR